MEEPIRIRKPAVLEEIPTDASSVVEASAGTGKTYALEHLIVELVLEEEISIPNILVVTFTERATAELVERVRNILRRLVRARDGDEVAEDEAHWSIGTRERDRLREALFSFDRAPIYTIHGFCHRVLLEHAFANRRPFEQELGEFDELFEEAFHRTLRKEGTETAGRAALLEAYLEDHSIDSLRSTLAAAVSTSDRVEPTYEPEAFGAVLREVRPTIEQMAETLRNAADSGILHGSRTGKVLRYLDGFRAGFEALDAHGIEVFSPAFAAELKSSDEHPSEYLGAGNYLTKESEDLFRAEWSDALERLGSYQISAMAPILSEFRLLVRDRLEQLKSEHGFFTYDDMLDHVRDGVRDADLVQTLRDEYEFALVDEFQDTDPVQWEIFRTVFYESDGANPCTLIGDPKQAIYGFRGADVRTYFEAADLVESGTGRAESIRLPDNYRSTPELIDAYNRILESNAENAFFREPNEYESPVGVGLEQKALVDADGDKVDPVVVTQITVGDDESLSADGYRGGLSHHWAREIRDLLDDSRAPTVQIREDAASEPRPIEPDDIYVLTRTRTEGDRFAQHLRAVGVPYAFYKRDGLFETAEARDWYELLRAIERPGDRSRRLKAWSTPFFGLDLADASEADEVVDENHALVGRLNRWNELGRSGRIGPLVYRVLDGSGLLRRRVFERHGERELTNYEHLAETFVDWAQSDALALDEIVARLGRYVRGEAEPEGREGDLQRLETEQQAVQIMTMHKVKGLSAPIVFLVGGFRHNIKPPYRYYDGDERILYFGGKGDDPDREERIEDYREEEDERLLYVAMTRPEGRLYVPYARPEDRDGELVRGTSPMGPLVERLDAILEGDVPAGFHIDEAPVDSSPPDDGDVGIESEIPRAGSVESISVESGSEVRKPVEEVDFGEMRARRRLFVESYSSIERWSTSSDDVFESSDEFALGEQADPDDFAPEEEAEPDGPPLGRATGLCVHELFERLDYDDIEEADSFEEWRDRRAETELFESLLARYGLQEDRRDVETLVWRALTTPVRTADFELPSVAGADRRATELGFWYPIPGEGGTSLRELLEAGRADGSTTDGYVRGFIDLVFEWNGRVYAADWKTNWLRGKDAYTPASVEEVVDERYFVQATLYATAAARIVARSVESIDEFERRFGGLLYLFARGMRSTEAGSSPGVYYVRPDFDQLCDWERRAGRLVEEKLSGYRARIARGAHDRWRTG